MAQSELSSAPTPKEQRAFEIYPDNRFFHLFMIGVSAILVAMEIICVARMNYRLRPPDLNDYAGFAAFLVAAGYCRWARFGRFLQVCLIVFWSFLLDGLLRFPVYLAARSRAPLQDEALAHFDRMAGLEVPAILRLMADHSVVKSVLAVSYDLLFPLMVFSVMLPAVMYRWRAAKELLVATSFATLLGSLMFALVPAVGPWIVYHYPPSAQQRACQALFLTLRTGGVHVLTPDDKGIICFPSFHVLLAILSCIALCSIKTLRIPAIVVTACVVISTLTTGWHYIADVLAGLTLAVAAVLVAKAYSRIEARFT
jgi:hypothetical protein